MFEYIGCIAAGWKKGGRELSQKYAYENKLKINLLMRNVQKRNEANDRQRERERERVSAHKMIMRTAMAIEKKSYLM